MEGINSTKSIIYESLKLNSPLSIWVTYGDLFLDKHFDYQALIPAIFLICPKRYFKDIGSFKVVKV